MSFIRHFGIYIAWIISLVATFASLYVGEVHGIEPCMLCWYQRVFMFPLVFILGYASYRHFSGIIRYVIALPLLGLVPSLYQIASILVGSNKKSCLGGVTCTWLHGTFFQSPYTMPLLSLIAFILIIFFLLISKRTISLDSNEEL